MLRLSLAVLAIVGEVAATRAAAAVMVCADRHLLAEVLDGREQAWQRAIGVTVRGELLELFMAADGRWTILATTRDGGACIVEDGQPGQAIPVAPKA